MMQCCSLCLNVSFRTIRFDQLLQKETVGISLDKEDPSLISSVLSLLIFLVRSEVMVDMLCRQGESCVLLTCYQCLLDPPSSEGKDTAHKIQVQVCIYLTAANLTGCSGRCELHTIGSWLHIQVRKYGLFW